MKMPQQVFFILVFFIFVGSPVALAFNVNAEAAQKYEQALIAKQNGENKAAIIHLKNALQLDNDYISAHILLGKLYLEENNGALAEKELIKANSLGADRSLTVVALAESYAQQFKYKEVIEKIFPLGYGRTISVKLYVLQGQASVELKALDNAESAFNDALKLDPDSIDAMLGLAAVLLQQGKFSEASEFVGTAQRIDKDNPDAWYVKGSIFHAMGSPEKAIKSYNKVITQKPDHMSALIARAGVFIDLGEDKKALSDVLRIRELNPNDPRAAYFHAVLLAKKGDDTNARKALMEASAIIDGLSQEAIREHSASLLLAGLIKFSLAEYEKANDYFSQYVRLYPQNPSARKLLGSTLIKKREFRNAIVTLEPALRVIPNDYKLLTMLGTAYMNVNKFTQASEMFDRALLLSNQDSSVRFKSALNQLAGGNKATAIDELDAVFSNDKDNGKAGILLAMLYVKALKFSQALNVARQLVDKNPDNLTALNLYGSILMANGDKPGAKKVLNKVISIDPTLMSAQINLIKINIQENKLTEAENRLQVLLKSNPGSELIMHELAIVSTRKGDAKAARRWLEKAQAKNPKSINAAVPLIDYYLANSLPKEAVRVGEEVESAHPENLRLMDALGRSYLAIGKVKTAQSVFRRMSLLANYNGRILYQVAKLQLQARDVEKAIWSLQKAVESDKTDLKSHVLLVEVLIRNAQFLSAREEAKKLAVNFPDKPQAYGLLGDISLAENKLTAAIKFYKKSLSIQASSRGTTQLSLAYRLAGNIKKSEQVLKQWLRKQPGDIAARQGLAEHYLRVGQTKKAAGYYEAVLKSGVNNASILNNLAMIYGDSDVSKALAYAKKAVELAPDQAFVLDTLGWLMVKHGDVSAGLTYLRDANARQSSSGEIHYHIAVALEKLGRKTEAVNELEEAIRMNGGFDGLENAKALLKQWNN